MTQKNTTHFFKQIAIGALLGLGSIIPGVSGGVIAVSMGLYQKLLDAVNGFFRAPKKHFLFLLPLGIGGGLSVLLLSTVVGFAMKHFAPVIIYLFVGLVLGGIPALVRESNAKGFRPWYLIGTVVGIGMLLLLARLESLAPAPSEGGILDTASSFLCGGILSFGTIIPGVSTSFLLMYLNLYDAFLGAISKLNVLALIPAGISFVLVSLCIVRIVGFLFRRFHGISHYTVLGLLVGSMFLVVPLPTFGWILIAQFAALLAGLWIGRYMAALGTRMEAQNEN